MKKTIYTTTRNFRCTDALSKALDALADKVHRHRSDIIRDAVVAYLDQFQDRTDELRGDIR